MKNDDILTGIALVGLAFAAYQFMRPAAARTAATPVNQVRPLTASGGKLPASASLVPNVADLGNTLYGGSAAARGMVQGIFAPGDSALTVANYTVGNGPMGQAMDSDLTLNQFGTMNGAYTFGSQVHLPTSIFG